MSTDALGKTHKPITLVYIHSPGKECGKAPFQQLKSTFHVLLQPYNRIVSLDITLCCLKGLVAR